MSFCIVLGLANTDFILRSGYSSSSQQHVGANLAGLHAWLRAGGGAHPALELKQAGLPTQSGILQGKADRYMYYVHNVKLYLSSVNM